MAIVPLEMAKEESTSLEEVCSKLKLAQECLAATKEVLCMTAQY